MKKVLFTAVFIGLFGFADAQTEEGGWLVGATSDLNFTSRNFDGSSDRVTSFNLNTSAGYFFIDNLAAGLNIGFNTTSQGNFSNNSFLIGPFARYYAGGQFFFGASFLSVTSSTDDGFINQNFNSTTLRFEAGYPIWIVDSVAIEPAFAYLIQNSDDFGDANSFGINVGFQLYF